MKLRRIFSVQPIYLPALMLIIAWSVAGCSASNESVVSESSTSEPQSSVGPTATEPDNNAFNGNLNATEANSGTVIVTDEINTDGVDEVVIHNAVVEDPLVQNTILVTFDITVPFYLSNKLRVDLAWGDINLTAKWVGGQFWSASGEFPTQTEHPLTITFYDDNGAVELARYSQTYRTASNVSEAVPIQAEQFDATPFDNDGDGVSNLDELNAGTNPFLDEDSLLEIKDFYSLSRNDTRFSRMSVSESFESRLPDDRPYIGTFDRDPDWGAWGELVLPDPSVDGDINIDADGNGTLTMQAGEIDRPFQIRLNGNRTHSESSISWEVVRQAWNDDYYHKENVTNTVSVIDENVREFVEVVTGSNTGTYEFTWEVNTNLTGNLIEGSSLCKPVAGSAVITHWTVSVRGRYASILTTTVSKEIDDPYWRVVEVENNMLETREYFVRELRVQQRTADPDAAFFVCDFVDLK